MDSKLSLKGAWSRHVKLLAILILVGANYISRRAKARVVEFCEHVGYVKSKHKDDKSPRTWSGSCDPL